MKVLKKDEKECSSSASELESSIATRLIVLQGELSDSGFAQKCNIPLSSMRKYLAGSMPGTDKLVQIAEACGVSIAWLAAGKGPMHFGGEKIEGVEDEFALVPLYDVEVSAGHGGHIDQEEIKSQIAFRCDWLSQNSFNINSLASLTARGDSMEPTIRDGDLLLIDIDQREVVEDGVYVLRLNNHLLAKRLQRLFDGTIYIKSDNPAYERQEVSKKAADQLQVIGRVVWTGRRM